MNKIEVIQEQSRLKKVAFDTFIIMLTVRIFVVYFIVPVSKMAWYRKGAWDVSKLFEI